MFARVTRWEGGDADAIREEAEIIRSDAESGPPEGVPAKAFKLLIDPEAGRSLGVVLFETEEDMRKGDEALIEMNPPMDNTGSRVSVETYEVAVDVEV